MLSDASLLAVLFRWPYALLVAFTVGLCIGMGAGGVYLLVQFKRRAALQHLPLPRVVSFASMLFAMILGVGVILWVISLVLLVAANTGSAAPTFVLFLVLTVLVTLIIMAPAVVIANRGLKRATAKMRAA